MSNTENQENNIYPKTTELVEEISKQPSKKQRKQLLRDKSLVGKNTDYKTYRSIASIIQEQYENARLLVNESKTLLTEVPDSALSSITIALENDLNKIEERVKYVTTAFNGVKGDGTRNTMQRIKVIQVAENASNLSEQMMSSILPTAAELGVKLVEHISKIEEDLNNDE